VERVGSPLTDTAGLDVSAVLLLAESAVLAGTGAGAAAASGAANDVTLSLADASDLSSGLTRFNEVPPLVTVTLAERILAALAAPFGGEASGVIMSGRGASAEPGGFIAVLWPEPAVVDLRIDFIGPLALLTEGNSGVSVEAVLATL
jgi:hypothetical protein